MTTLLFTIMSVSLCTGLGSGKLIDFMITLQSLRAPSLLRVVLPLLCVWVITSIFLVNRVQTFGAFASLSFLKTLLFIQENGQASPGSVRLDQSYSQWALALNLTDPANYIKVGLGFAEGKGISLKNISQTDPNSETYLAYYFQSPGTPIVIGTMIKLFGEKSIFPYFLLILFMHFVTAILTCVLASRFIVGDAYILGVGLLALLCTPALDFNFAAGLFSSEPLAAPCLVAGLICLSSFWKQVTQESFSYKLIALSAIGFGSFLAASAYFRDIYTTFAYFCLAAIFASVFIMRKHVKAVILFVLLSLFILQAVEYPWEKRNQRHFNEFTMSGSTYCGYSLWHFIWEDYHDLKDWGWRSGHGMGNYLAPEKSTEVLKLLDADKKRGSVYAFKCLVEAVCKHPIRALRFKIRVWRTLWFGQRSHLHIYYWCVISTIAFIAFLVLTKFQFMPELWLFPLFLLCLSPIIHFEHRYSQPFFLLITPITTMYVCKYLMLKFRRSSV